MKKTAFFLGICMCILTTGFSPKGPSVSAYEICLNTFKNTKSIKTLSYIMEKEERVDGEMISQTSYTKMQRSPFKVYLRQQAPNDGLEVLYVTGKYGDKALINPNGFPWINVSLDPMSSSMRKDQHHTLYDAGFDLVISILEHLFEKYGDETPSMVTLDGSAMYDNHDCWVITFTNPHYKIVDYKVQASETLLTIAEKYKLSEFSILEMNEDIDDYEDVEEGQIIQIPNDYSPGMVLYIDKARNIPLVMKVSDHKGLYETYYYHDVVIDPEFSAEDFSKENEEYGF